MFSLIFFSWCAQEIGNIFGNLAILIAYSEKKKNLFSFLKSQPSTQAFLGELVFLKTPAWEATKKWSWNIFGNLAILTAYSDKKKVLFPLTGGPLDAPSL